MDIKELRIGNLVMDAFGDPVKVAFIIIKHNISGYSPETLQPIPLTEEILVKAGFSKHKNSNKYFTIWWLPNKWYINQSHHTEPSAGVRNGYFYYSYDYVEFQYLHQLQNLYFALTGEELEIKL